MHFVNLFKAAVTSLRTATTSTSLVLVFLVPATWLDVCLLPFVVDSSPVSDKSEEERLSSSGPELLETVLPEFDQ